MAPNVPAVLWFVSKSPGSERTSESFDSVISSGDSGLLAMLPTSLIISPTAGPVTSVLTPESAKNGPAAFRVTKRRKRAVPSSPCPPAGSC